jgi:hypothetical protein
MRMSTSKQQPTVLLLPVFFETIFPMVEGMVCQDGKYAGYTPIFEGDKAGPHQDSKLLNGVKGYCGEQKGWHWQPQAVQMPHMNVLDLSVFPCMSKRHTDKSQESVCKDRSYETVRLPRVIFKLIVWQRKVFIVYEYIYYVVHTCNKFTYFSTFNAEEPLGVG